MSESNPVFDIFFAFLNQFSFREESLDYSVLSAHIRNLATLSQLSNSGITIFNIHKKQVEYHSPNYAGLLGFSETDTQNNGLYFFESRIHPDDKYKLAVNGISVLKLFNSLSAENKFTHKVLSEYRALNQANRYIRLIEQYQVLELDKNGQLWLLMSIVDVAPNQEEDNVAKSQLLNFKTGQLIQVEESPKPQVELTGRELEILRLVKEGLLSKEISTRLSISVHTVNTHRQRVLEKLGANNSVEAILFAGKYGLLT